MPVLDPTLAILLSAIIGYALGSVPFGLVITRLAGLGDIRTIGSGNIGATNVLRTGRRDLAALTLLLDAGKAGLAFFIGALVFGWGPGLAAGAAAFFGHCFPIWLGFRGGKGVATFVGLLLAAMWPVGLLFAAVWLATAGVFRRSSLAALTATALTPVFAGLTGYGWPAIATTAGLGCLIFYRHAANIDRLLKGEEPKFGAGKTPKSPPPEA
jgi:glycerol-3-phosphate acyltransferase PlsY